RVFSPRWCGERAGRRPRPCPRLPRREPDASRRQRLAAVAGERAGAEAGSPEIREHPGAREERELMGLVASAIRAAGADERRDPARESRVRRALLGFDEDRPAVARHPPALRSATGLASRSRDVEDEEAAGAERPVDAPEERKQRSLP